jgi:hypothetical protein
VVSPLKPCYGILSKDSASLIGDSHVFLVDFFDMKFYSPVCRLGCFAPNLLRGTFMADLTTLKALAEELAIDMDTTEDRQGELLVGTGGVLSTPSAMPVAESGVGSESPRHVISGPADSSPVGQFVYDAQAGDEVPCGGVLGGTPGRFCCTTASACLVQSHQQKRFGATAGHAYIRCSRAMTAHCMPALNLEEAALVVRERLECGGTGSIQVWSKTFEGPYLNNNEDVDRYRLLRTLEGE